MVVTSTAQITMRLPLISSMFVVPICVVYDLRIAEPAIPPSGAPPPMNPKRRLACRGSYTRFASVQNWLIRSTPRRSAIR